MVGVLPRKVNSLAARESGGLDVRVSEATLERALPIMSQVLAVLEQRGFSVKVTEQGVTTALINGESVRMGIEEPIRRVVTQKPHVPNPTDRWDYDEIVTHEPGGKLALVIHSGLWGKYEQRTRWSDAKIQRVETLVPDFVAGLMRSAIALQRQEEERKQREVEQQRRAQERAHLQKQIQEEEEKLEQLNNWVQEWERRNDCDVSSLHIQRKLSRGLPKSNHSTRHGSNGRRGRPTGSIHL